MPSPFPGMDPYLENPSGFSDFHHELISLIKQTLNDRLHPRYFARAEDRVYVSHEDDPGRHALVPDVTVKHLEVERRLPGHGTVGSLAVAEPLEMVTLIDEEIREPFISIHDSRGERVVTVIE